MVRIMKNVMTGDKTPPYTRDESNSSSSESDSSSSNSKDERSLTGDTENSNTLSEGHKVSNDDHFET